jgi:hypothetical protein
MTPDDRGLEERLRRLHMPLPASVRSAVFAAERPPRRPASFLAIGTAIAAPAVVIILLLLTVAPNFHLRGRTQQATGVVQALSAGAPAVVPQRSDRRFVWLTGAVTQPPTPPQPAGSHGKVVTGTMVEVLDWTGTSRYRFQLPHSTLLDGFNDVQAISGDGTRALLIDGTVLDQSGAVVGKIPALNSNGPADNHVRWMSDNSAVCEAVSNEPVAPPSTAPPPVKGQGTPSPPPVPPYAQPGADHSVTLKVFGLDGTVRNVATVGGPLAEPSGATPDTTSVLACAPNSDLAVVARYHDADSAAAGTWNPATNMTVSLWAIRLSSGEVLNHVPETRMALGRAFFFGSQNGQLAVEFLWNSKVWGSETDVVLQMPSGRRVPLSEAEVPDTFGLSADGTRILRRVADQAGSQTALELIDAGDGRVIRRVVVPGMVAAQAVAEPGGSSFMVVVDGHFALVDGDGGISVLNPGLKSPGTTGVGLPFLPGLQN